MQRLYLTSSFEELDVDELKSRVYVTETKTTCEWWGKHVSSHCLPATTPRPDKDRKQQQIGLRSATSTSLQTSVTPANTTQTYIKLSFHQVVMDVLDGATSLHSEMSEDAQRWIETASNRTKSRSSAS
jgi:hypothetical protein